MPLKSGVVLDIGLLRDMLSADPASGVLTWKVNVNKQKAGARAGSPHKSGYRNIGILNRQIREHRVLFALVNNRWPENDIDHINGDRSDNRICNLREATRMQNGANRVANKIGTTRYKGVTMYHGKFMVQIGSVNRIVGLFDTIEEARDAYAKAAAERYGEFAKVAERDLTK